MLCNGQQCRRVLEKGRNHGGDQTLWEWQLLYSVFDVAIEVKWHTVKVFDTRSQQPSFWNTYCKNHNFARFCLQDFYFLGKITCVHLHVYLNSRFICHQYWKSSWRLGFFTCQCMEPRTTQVKEAGSPTALPGAHVFWEKITHWAVGDHLISC